MQRIRNYIALPSPKSKGFVSSVALILFVISCSIVTTYAINVQNYMNVIDDLKVIERNIIDKTKVVSYFKGLDKTKTINDFMVDGIYVEVYKNDDEYKLIYKNEEIRLKVQDNRLVDLQ